MGFRTSASGLVLPGVSSTAWMLGLAPAPEEHTWLDKLIRVYLVARDYLPPFDTARGGISTVISGSLCSSRSIQQRSICASWPC